MTPNMFAAVAADQGLLHAGAGCLNEAMFLENQFHFLLS